MPRITETRRTAIRDGVVAAARACFARNGFHHTSMPDIATQAGMSTGAPYRYIGGKQELIVEVTTQAFRFIFAPVLEMAQDPEADISIGGLVAAAIVTPPASDSTDAATVDELLRCSIHAWSELLGNDAFRIQAREGIGRYLRTIEDGLRRGQEAGTVPADIAPDSAARIVVAMIHGLIVQRMALEYDDVDLVRGDIKNVFGEGFT